MYNGIWFSFPKTESHAMGAGLDPSHSDQLYTDVSFRVRAIINAQLLPADITDAGSIANTIARIYHYLTQPRADFYYDLDSPDGQTGANPIWDISGGRDDANGPFPDPKAIDITYTTPGYFDVTWGCTFKLRGCGGDRISVPLSLRWEDSVEFDRYMKATYRRSGTMIVSSLSDFDIDQYRRNKIAPQIAPGFAREQAHYTISRDGLRCDFVFVDSQIRYAPPYPAVDMDIVQSESLPLMGTGMREGNVTVTMRGAINANPVDLKNWAFAVAYCRVNAAYAQGDIAKRIPWNGNFQTQESKDSVNAQLIIKYRLAPNDHGLKIPPATGQGWGLGILGNINPATGVLNSLLNGVGSLVNQQGKSTQIVPQLGWVGRGTSAQSALNPIGHASWASQTGQIGGPADGVLLAPQVKLFAALLNDPCGQALSTKPDAAEVTLTARVNASQWNDPTNGGQGGDTAVSNAQLQASFSTLNADQYPTTGILAADTTYYTTDGQPGYYSRWQCMDEYADDPGTMVLPVCNPDNGVNVAINYSTAGFTLYRRWSAMRSGAPPRIPPKQVNKPSGEVDPNWVYVGALPGPGLREIRLDADQSSFVYEAEGCYIFQCLDAALVDQLAPIPPFVNQLVASGVAGWYGGAELTAIGDAVAGVVSSLFSSGSGGGGATSPLGSNNVLNPIGP